MDQETIITGVMVLSAACVLILSARQKGAGDDRYRREKARIVVAGVYAAGLLLWPVICSTIIGWDKIKAHPILGIAFAWTVGAFAWELFANMGEETDHEAMRATGDTRTNANVIIGAAWAVGSLLAVVRATGSQSSDGARILLMALVLCIAFVIPLPIDENPRTIRSRVVRSSQRSVLYYAVGLFIAGIIISWKDK